MRKLALLTLIASASFLFICGIGALLGFPPPTVLEGYHISGLTLYGSDLYFGAGLCLYRLDTQEQMLHEIVCTQDWTFQRPAVDGERAYAQILTSPDGRQFFVAIDLSTGATVWRANEGWPSEAFLRGTKQYTFLINDRVVTARKGGVDVFDTQSGRRTWHSGHNWMDGINPFVIYGDSIWYPIREDESSGDGELVGVKADTGDTLQTINLLPEAEFEQVLYVDDRWVFGLDNRFDPFKVFGVDRTRPSEVRWRRELASQTLASQPILYDDTFIFESGRIVYALDAHTGQPVWTVESGYETIPADGFEQAVIFVLPQKRDGYWTSALCALDAMSGAVIWRYTLNTTRTMPVVVGNTVYVANKDSIDAIDLKSGQLLWQTSVDSLYELYADSP